MLNRREPNGSGIVVAIRGKTCPFLSVVGTLYLLAGCAGPGPNSLPAQAESAADWELIWNDEFDQGRIDPAKWEHEVDCSGGGNNEAQCYTDRPENAFVDMDGVLHIVAREERISGPAHSQGSPDYRSDDSSATRDYSSARLRTKDRLDFRYGRIEVRARLPAGQGTWPAIWMLPTDWVYGGWPSSGEIDIMEAINLDDGAEHHAIHGTLHYGLKWPQWSVAGAEYDIPGSATREFRTYTLEWEADEMRWYVDGVHYQTQTSSGWYNYIWQGQDKGFEVASARAPFDQKFHLLLNLAIGGHAPGPADSDWAGEREFLVDYVRVYQCQVDLESGTGCSSSSADSDNAAVTFTQDTGAPAIRSFTLFDDAPATLTLASGGREVENRITLRGQSLESGNVEFEIADLGGAHGGVLDITFKGTGQLALASASMRDNGHFTDGFALPGGGAWSVYGTIEFDLFIDSIDANTALVARLGNHFPNFGQVPIDIRDTGTWMPVNIRIADLIDNPKVNGADIDLNQLDYLLAIATTGTGNARVQLDNIRLTCAVNENARSWQPAPECSIKPIRNVTAISGNTDIFVDAITRWAASDCCNGATATMVDDELEPERGKVIEFSYQTDETVTHFQSESAMDFSVLAGGTLEFDLLIVSNPDKPVGNNHWLMTASCGHPCGSGELLLSGSAEGRAPTLGRWQHFTFNIDDLVAGGLDLSNVVAPLAIFPRWGNQQGAVFRIDNVVVKAPAQGAIKLAD